MGGLRVKAKRKKAIEKAKQRSSIEYHTKNLIESLGGIGEVTAHGEDQNFNIIHVVVDNKLRKKVSVKYKKSHWVKDDHQFSIDDIIKESKLPWEVER